MTAALRNYYGGPERAFGPEALQHLRNRRHLKQSAGPNMSELVSIHCTSCVAWNGPFRRRL